MRNVVLLAILASSGAPALYSQRTAAATTLPRGTVALGYSFLSANAPPGQQQGFTGNGGFASIGFNINPWFGIAAEANGLHSTDISSFHQDLTLYTYTAGPRITARQRHTEEFAQALFGAAMGRDSYFPQGNTYTANATSFALTAGGGLDVHLSRAVDLRALELQYLHSALPNGVNNSQNQLLLGAGIVFKFGHLAWRSTTSAEAPRKRVALTCSANVRILQSGESLEVTALARQTDGEDVTYVWTSNSGILPGNTSIISLDTTGLTPGHYHITGHASLVSDASVSASCDVPFRIATPPKAPLPPPPPPPPPPAPAPTAAEAEFHQNVQDVYFDYDKWNLRPDTQAGIARAADYLKTHPTLRVLVGGYSDERGSTNYNIALGLKRANAVRDALVEAGISADRIQVVSYGKGVQVCTNAKEACYQRNRRAAFLLQP